MTARCRDCLNPAGERTGGRVVKLRGRAEGIASGHDRTEPRAPAIVMLPAEIDLTNAEQACDRLCAAFASGAPVVIADFTATTFCDCSSMRRLLAVRHRAAARHAELRLAVPLGGEVRRLLELTGLGRHLSVDTAVA